MRKKMVNNEYTNLATACRQPGEEQINKMLEKLILPEVCSKPNCGGIKFIKHEDGYQCLNCFKIVYVLKADNNRHKGNKQLFLI